MRDSYLVDGYNLIHALGMIRRDLPPGGLEQSRRALLAFLVRAFGDRASDVTVVFDARHAPPGVSRTQEFDGLHVQFAAKNESADDLIEALIDEAAQPEALVVISGDHRLQAAARRRGAQAWSHDELLDFLEKPEATTPPGAGADTPKKMSPEELRRWLTEFGYLENDPEFKEFFDYDKFE